jgi:8-oxo-dGTP pyrophosphatase MutT (NUDIX family)
MQMHAREGREPLGGTAIIERALDAYRPSDASERADVQRLRALLAGADVRDRATPVHVTGSALVVHPLSRRVLLRWHPRMQMWMQVGGHFDAGETDPWLVAVREAREETGLTDLRAAAGVQAPEPMQIVIVPVPAHGDDPAHEHADFRYLLVTDRPGDVVAESSAAVLRWTTLEAAIAEADEPNLRVFLSRVADVLDSRYSSTIGDMR